MWGCRATTDAQLNSHFRLRPVSQPRISIVQQQPPLATPEPLLAAPVSPPHRRRNQRSATITSVALLVSCVLLGLTACGERIEDTHPDRWVSQRQAIFKDFTRTLEPIGMMARERKPFDAAEFTKAAQALQSLGHRPWPLFPADSNYPPTKALPQVWAEPAEFEQAQLAFRESLLGLVQAAQVGTLEAARPAVEDVQQKCKTCHDGFRRP